MKNKISLFILCGIVLLGVCGCGSQETKSKKKETIVSNVINLRDMFI